MDPRFFRKYLDIVSEAPNQGIGSNAPVRPTQQTPNNDEDDYNSWAQADRMYRSVTTGAADQYQDADPRKPYAQSSDRNIGIYGPEHEPALQRQSDLMDKATKGSGKKENQFMQRQIDQIKQANADRAANPNKYKPDGWNEKPTVPAPTPNPVQEEDEVEKIKKFIRK